MGVTAAKNQPEPVAVFRVGNPNGGTAGKNQLGPVVVVVVFWLGLDVQEVPEPFLVSPNREKLLLPSPWCVPLLCGLSCTEMTGHWQDCRKFRRKEGRDRLPVYGEAWPLLVQGHCCLRVSPAWLSTKGRLSPSRLQGDQSRATGWSHTAVTCRNPRQELREGPTKCRAREHI